MDARRAWLGWSIGQAIVAVAMLSSPFWLVTGWIWWLALNGAAGLAAAVAAASLGRPDRARRASAIATALFAPINLAIGLMNLVAGRADGPIVGIIALSLVQALLAWDAYRASGGGTDQPSS